MFDRAWDYMFSSNNPPLFKPIKETDTYKKLRDDYIGLQEAFEDIAERLNNAENRASEAEQRMKVMTALRNKDLIAERATHVAKSVNNLYVWAWKSPEERTRAIEILIEQLLIVQIEGNADWTDYNISDKG